MWAYMHTMRRYALSGGESLPSILALQYYQFTAFCHSNIQLLSSWDGAHSRSIILISWEVFASVSCEKLFLF